MSEPSFAASVLDLVGPPCGPCAFCGGDDKRHRMVDTIWERQQAGETAASVAYDYDLNVWAVLLIGILWDPS